VGYAACCQAVGGVNWLDRLNTVTCPTLIIAGALDVGAPVSMSQAMAERIKGSQLVVLEEASHLSVAEQPALFAQHLGAFLARVG
jgi:3-oxoadipate enol-lactonase